MSAPRRGPHPRGVLQSVGEALASEAIALDVAASDADGYVEEMIQKKKVSGICLGRANP